MAWLFSGLIDWLRSLFFAKHLEVTIVGLQVSHRLLISSTKIRQDQIIFAAPVIAMFYVRLIELPRQAARRREFN